MTEAIIRGRPVTKGRPRLGRRRRAFTPARTIAYETLVADEWDRQNEGNEPLTGPLGCRFIIGSEGVEVEIWELEQSFRPKYVTGDIDNYLKSLSDGLNGHAYVDDKQIHHLESFFTKEVIV